MVHKSEKETRQRKQNTSSQMHNLSDQWSRVLNYDTVYIDLLRYFGMKSVNLESFLWIAHIIEDYLFCIPLQVNAPLLFFVKGYKIKKRTNIVENV